MHTEHHMNPSIDNKSAPLARQPVFSGGCLVPYFVCRANPSVLMKWIWSTVFLSLIRAPSKGPKGLPDAPKTPRAVRSTQFTVHSAQFTVPSSQVTARAASCRRRKWTASIWVHHETHVSAWQSRVISNPIQSLYDYTMQARFVTEIDSCMDPSQTVKSKHLITTRQNLPALNQLHSPETKTSSRARAIQRINKTNPINLPTKPNSSI